MRRHQKNCRLAIVSTLLLRLLAASMLVAGGATATLHGATEPTQSQAADIMVVGAETTFLREAPDVRAPVVARLERGARVEVLDRTGDWWRVRAGDPPREGYVHRLVLAPASPEDAPPTPDVPQPTDEPTEPPADNDKAEEVDPGGEPLLKPVRTRAQPNVRGFAGIGWFVPVARESFDAVAITGAPMVIGGGVEVTDLYRQVFVRGTVERASETGERVFLTPDGQRFGLGIPLEVRLTPIEATAGWRFGARRGRGRVVPFVGGGAGVLRYQETDEFADADDEVDEQFASYHVLGGADIAVLPWLAMRVEYRYRLVPDALGEGGVSAIKDDTSLGGSTFGVAVVVGR